MPIADEDSEVASSIQRVAQEVAMAYETGQKVYVHCGSGGDVQALQLLLY